MYPDSTVDGEVFLINQLKEMHAGRNEIQSEIYRIWNSRVLHCRYSNWSKFSNYWRKNSISQLVQVTVFNRTSIWVFHDRRFCQIIWQIFTQGRAKKNSSKIAHSGDWNQDLRIFRPMPLPTELGRNLLDRRFLKWALFVSCTTSHVGLCSFLESIEHDFIKTMKIQAGNWMLT